MSDEWRDIPGFSGTYQASTAGQIRSNLYYRTLNAPVEKDRPYRQVLLMVPNGGKKHARVHTLVALTFLGPARGRWVVHKNGDSLDNRLENLRYSEPGERPKAGRKEGR